MRGRWESSIPRSSRCGSVRCCNPTEVLLLRTWVELSNVSPIHALRHDVEPMYRIDLSKYHGCMHRSSCEALINGECSLMLVGSLRGAAAAAPRNRILVTS